jgi:drug/metabolite transporter (DMT)-like permease
MPHHWKSSPAIALSALVGVTAVWGATFVLVKNAISVMPVMDFLAVRFLTAAVVMIAIRPAVLRNMTRRGFLRGVGLGVVLGSGYVAQTFGLLTASATVSGFITGMFVVFTPIVSWVLLGRRVSRNAGLAVALATVGLALLGLRGWNVGNGEMLTLACALLFAVHIVGLGAWASQQEPYGFALVQIGTVAVISLAAAMPHGLSVPAVAGVWVAIGVTAVFATAVAFVVQTGAQSLLSPTHAAVVMTLEPVFAGVFGVAFGGDSITPRVIAGAALILVATLFVQRKQTPRFT